MGGVRLYQDQEGEEGTVNLIGGRRFAWSETQKAERKLREIREKKRDCYGKRRQEGATNTAGGRKDAPGQG